MSNASDKNDSSDPPIDNDLADVRLGLWADHSNQKVIGSSAGLIPRNALVFIDSCMLVRAPRTVRVWQPDRNIIEIDCDAAVLSVQLAPEARVVQPVEVSSCCGWRPLSISDRSADQCNRCDERSIQPSLSTAGVGKYLLY
jgi:hypothetical protein